MNNMIRDLWYTLWGVGLAFAIQVLYSGINEYPNLSRGFWLGLVINGFIFAILVVKGEKLTTEREEQKEESKGKEEDEEKPDIPSLIAEYQVLNEFLEKRRSNTLLVINIILPASLLIVSNAFSQKANNFAFFIPILASIMVFVSWLFYWTKNKLDEVCWERIHEIEDVLHIKGHRHIEEQIKCDMWYKVRCYMWHFACMHA